MPVRQPWIAALGCGCSALLAAASASAAPALSLSGATAVATAPGTLTLVGGEWRGHRAYRSRVGVYINQDFDDDFEAHDDHDVRDDDDDDDVEFRYRERYLERRIVTTDEDRDDDDRRDRYRGGDDDDRDALAYASPIEACHARYRSFDEGSGTYLSESGERRLCPYLPTK